MVYFSDQATDQTAGEQRFAYGQNCGSVFETLSPAAEYNRPPIQLDPWALSLEEQRPERETDHLHQYKNELDHNQSHACCHGEHRVKCKTLFKLCIRTQLLNVFNTQVGRT